MVTNFGSSSSRRGKGESLERDQTHDQVGRRSYLERAALASLNLIAPGLGLARLGKWREAGQFLFAPFVFLALFTLGLGYFPIVNYNAAVLALVLVVGLSVALYAAPALLTWRYSLYRLPAHGWSCWYGLTAIFLALVFLSDFAAPMMHHFYRPFYAYSESMAPTIGKDEKFVADMRWRGPIKRGEIVVFKGSYGVRVDRIAAIPGDRIKTRGGVPILNGKTVIQSADRRAAIMDYKGVRFASIRAERLPGEKTAHQVIEGGRSEFDQVQEVLVPADHIFVLGDNRDRSADSRVPLGLGGVGMVPFSAIVGRPMYIYWSSDHSKIGTQLSH